METAWLIGSTRNLDATLTIGVSPQQIEGDFYLWHPTSGLSLLAAVEAAMTAAGVPDASAVLTKDRRVKLSASATFSMTIPSTLRNLLGFTTNLAAASTYTGQAVPSLLWSSGKPLTPELSPIGTLGIERPLSYTSQSPYDGTTFTVTHGSRIDQKWSVQYVTVDRVFTPAQAGGEYVQFFNTCLAKGYSFHVYPEVEEVAGSSDEVTLSDGLGPYALTPSARAPGWSYDRSRGKTYTDEVADIDIPCRVVPEYA
jgi:hypothetical protein